MQPGLSPIAGGSAAAADSLLSILRIPTDAGGTGAAADPDLRAWEREMGEWY